MPKSINDHCIQCGTPFGKQVKHQSSLCGSAKNWFLCPICIFDEDAAMIEEGTNSIPWLVTFYEESIKELELV